MTLKRGVLVENAKTGPNRQKIPHSVPLIPDFDVSQLLFEEAITIEAITIHIPDGRVGVCFLAPCRPSFRARWHGFRDFASLRAE
jgi:hypothetical protein